MQNNQSFWQSSTAKIILVGLLTLVLLIPLQYVKSLINERAERQEDVVTEINQKWGGNVFFYGPVLKVPYKQITETTNIDPATKKAVTQQKAFREYAYFFPENLKMTAGVPTKGLNRNNYESAVFDSKMNFKGNYTTPDFTSQNIGDTNVEWEKATVLIETTNLKGITGGVTIKLNGKDYAFEPIAAKSSRDTTVTLETKAINLRDAFAEQVAFNLDVKYKGSKAIQVVPIGKITEATMTSNWHTPSFTGNYIPESKTINDNGFTANWKISYLNRPFPQQHFGEMPDLTQYTFDTNFLIPVNEYQKNERASKYGFLVIGLTFLIFFLIQSISRISIHIFQYTMIGLALIMFYTLLISITEHSSFRLAYIIAGLSVVIMITVYSYSILKNVKFPMLIAFSLSALYSFIYVIIQLENYALLAGSIGLFLILGAVMYFSRKIDWNSHLTDKDTIVTTVE